jgi:hypothetical protein
MGLMSDNYDSYGNMGGIDDEPYRPGLMQSAKNWMSQDKNKHALMQMVQAIGQPINGTRGASSSQNTLGIISNMLGAFNQSNMGGYDEHARNKEMKQLQMDEFRAQGEGRQAQAASAQAKAASDQKRQALIASVTQNWNSPNQGMSNGPTMPEYANVAQQFKSNVPQDPRDRYGQIASALENAGDMDAAMKYRLDSQKLSPEVNKYDVQMVNGQPRSVALMKDGSYKVLDGVAPTAKQHFQDLGDRTVAFNEYTGLAGASFAKGQTADSKASNANSLRIAGMTDARAREFNAITRQGNGAQYETGLRKEFADLPEVKNYKAAYPSFDSIRSASQRNTPQSDINLIYGLAKLYDPNSVVREGEYATVANSPAIPERLKGYMQYMAGGGKLSPDTKKQIMAEAEARIGSYEQQYQGAQQAYGSIAEKRGLSTDNIFTPVGRVDQKGRRPTDNASKGGFKILSVD